MNRTRSGAKECPPLLPETDFVMFFDESLPESQRMLGKAPRRKVTAIAGYLMLDEQMFPPRHYISTFPSSVQLQALFSDR